MFKICTGGFSHETNTFNVMPTLREYFHEYRGREIIEEFKETNTILGGFISAAETFGFELIPTIFAEASPTTGLIAREAMEHYKDKIVEAMGEIDCDGVLLSLHGAAAAEGYDSPESEILKSLRESLREEIPIVVGCDYHANIHEDWIKYSDAIVAFKTSPHVDMFERGLEAGQILYKTLKGEISPVMEIKKPALFVKGGLMTIVDTPLYVHKSPFFFAVNKARKYERRKEVINVSVCAGFGDADVPHAGISIVAITDRDERQTEEIVNDISNLLWQLRHGLSPDLVLTPLDEAIDMSLNAKEGPIILADEGDNPAGGGPADATFILQALKDAGWPSSTLFIKDTEVVKEAEKAGVGNKIKTMVGGKTDKLHGDPVETNGVVKTLSDGEFYEPLTRRVIRMGRTAVIRCGETDIIITEKSTSQIHPAYFESVGISPAGKKITIVKSAHYFRAGFEPIVKPKMILEVDTPGVSNPNPHRFKYEKIRRPIFPLDPI